MQSPLLAMSYQERIVRAQAKRTLILTFLASGEMYSTTQIIARLLANSPSSAERTLVWLVKSGALKTEQHLIGSRLTNIYGITSHGLALADVFDMPYFQLGRTNSAYIPHHLETQTARLNSESAGWTSWQPGKTMHNLGLKKIPDALVINPAGMRVAIEIERHIKTPKRYSEIISSHLQSITQNKWDEVHYISNATLFKKVAGVFQHINSIPVLGEKMKLEQKHRDRFKFFDLSSWPYPYPCK